MPEVTDGPPSRSRAKPSATTDSPRRRRSEFPRATATLRRSPAAFARFALDLEAEAVAAYTSAAAEITRPGLRRPLGSIMACESAHEVALRAVAGLPLLAGTAGPE